MATAALMDAALAYSALAAIAAVAVGVRLLRHKRAAVDLLGASLATGPLGETPPFVSILIPARNEEDSIERCVRAALAQTYPTFEVVVCDDDSTDRTPTILDRLASQDSRLRVVPRRGAPPPGWVGKNRALATAAEAAKGEWLLCIDADCIVAPDALRAAMGRALAPLDGARRSLVSALPHVECRDLANRLLMPTFGFWISVAAPLHLVNDPRRREALAAGGFLLIHREALEAIGGHSRLASHIVEDVLTARLVKSSGRRIETFVARGAVTTRMYDGWGDLWEGITKNAFAATDFRLGVAALGVVAILGLAVVPALLSLGIAGGAVAAGSLTAASAALLGLLAIPVLVLLVLHVGIAIELGIPAGYALLAPAGHAIYAAALVVSSIRGSIGRGIAWKGRQYYGAGGGVPSDKLLS